MGVEVKVLKIEGIPTGNTVTFSIKFKDEDATAVTPSEARTNRRVAVNADYPHPEWKNESYYFKPTPGKKYTLQNPRDDGDFLDNARPKFYLWAVGSVYDSRLASGRINFRSAFPGKPVREVFHLTFESGVSSPGRSCQLTLELLADLTEEMTGVSVAGPIMNRLPPASPSFSQASPGLGGAKSPQKGAAAADNNNNNVRTTSPTSRGRSLSFSRSPGAAGTASPARSEASGIFLSGDGNRINFSDETNVDNLLENLQRVFPILEQRLHITARSLDRRDRQLLDMKSRLVRKTSEATGLQNDSKASRDKAMELTDKLKAAEDQLDAASKKAAEGAAAEKLASKMLKDKDETIGKLRKELVEKRESEEEAVREKKSVVAELERLKKKLQNAENDKDRTASNAELFAEKTIAEVRVHGLTAELAEAQHQLSRSRGRETMLIENNVTLQTRAERLSYDLEKKTVQLSELHRTTEKQLDERHTKVNEVLARQDQEVKQSRQEKEHILRDLDRLRVNLNDTELKLRDAEATVQSVKHHQRDLLQELDDTKAELLRVKELMRMDQTELQAELTTARENENAAKRKEDIAEADAKNFRLQLQDKEREKQKVDNEYAELKVRLEAAKRRAADLENDIKKERQATETAVQQSRDIMEASTAETLRMGEMLKISQELASSLADQLRNERQQKEAAEADKDRVKEDADAEKKRLDDQREREKNALIQRETERVFAYQIQSLMALERTARDAFTNGFDQGVDSLDILLDYSAFSLIQMEQQLVKMTRQRDALTEELHRKEEEEKARLLAEQERRNRELAEKEAAAAEDDPDTCEIGLDPIPELVQIEEGLLLKNRSGSFSSAAGCKVSPSKQSPKPLGGPMKFGLGPDGAAATSGTSPSGRSKSPGAGANAQSPTKSLSRPPPPPAPGKSDSDSKTDDNNNPSSPPPKKDALEETAAGTSVVLNESTNNKQFHADPNASADLGDTTNASPNEPIAPPPLPHKTNDGDDNDNDGKKDKKNNKKNKK